MRNIPAPNLAVRLLEQRYHAQREREYQALQAMRAATLLSLIARPLTTARRRLHGGRR